MPSSSQTCSDALGSIGQGVGQIAFARAFLLFQPRQRRGLGLKPDDLAQAGRQHRLVGRIAIDGIGADIHDARWAAPGARISVRRSMGLS